MSDLHCMQPTIRHEASERKTRMNDITPGTTPYTLLSVIA